MLLKGNKFVDLYVCIASEMVNPAPWCRVLQMLTLSWWSNSCLLWKWIE